MRSNSDGRRTHGGDKSIEEVGAGARRIAREAPFISALASDPYEEDSLLPGGVRSETAGALLAPPGRGALMGMGEDVLEGEFEDDEVEEGIDPPEDHELLAVVKSAISLNETGEFGQRRAEWNRSYRAFRNKHSDGSRYLKKEYGARSRLYIPKTRAAVKKAMTSAATALFSTSSAVSITPENGSDARAKAGADLMNKLVNIRLDRASANEGIPWFLISMGAAQESAVVGLCCSKQYWLFEERNGRTVRDRPEVDLVPLDDVLLDTAAKWTDPVQTGRFFMVRYPMRVIDVRERMKAGSNSHGGGAWIDAPEKVMGEATNDYRSQGTRTARQGGQDRYSANAQVAVKDFDIVWVYECFVRMDGEDWHFWSLSGRSMLSEPIPTHEAYKHNQGERPYVMGFGALEAHNLYPMSMAESMQPLQAEINDIRNMRIDSVRQSISPIAVVRRGNRVDLKNLHYRGPDATIMVKEDGDVKFDRAPDVSQGAFAEADRLNADIDELTGSFSTSSVQSNRALGETVGGMQLMAGANNAITEFDLRVFVETWVEPTLRQLVRLEQHFETNETLIQRAGNMAELEKQGINPLELDLEDSILVKVDLGIGSADPMQKLAKFTQAADIAAKVASTGLFAGQITGNAEGMLGEIFGLAGYPDIKRFFEFKEAAVAKEENEAKEAAEAQANAKPAPTGPDPQIEAGKMDLEGQRIEIERMKTEAKIENDKALAKIRYAEMLIKKNESEGRMSLEEANHDRTGMQMEFDQIDREEGRAMDQEDRAFARSQPPAGAPRPRTAAPVPSPRPRMQAPANDRMSA